MKSLDVYNLEIGYRMMLEQVLHHPDRVVSPRGESTHEVDTMVIEHHSPEDALLVNVGRKLSPTLAVVEALQLIGGFTDPKVTVAVAPQYERFRDGEEFYGAYGVRAGQWFESASDKLKRDVNTRQAVVTLWDNNLDNVNGMHDYPCSVYVRFAVRDEQLRTTVHMRSNDAWLGYPYDVYQWTAVHRTMASFIGVVPGPYTHIVDSFHLYERNFEEVKTLLDRPMGGTLRTQLYGGVLNTGTKSGDPNTYDWSSVQKRARAVFDGQIIANPSIEERYMMKYMRAYHGKPTPDELSGKS